jgi:methionine-rich copper-binding protein CopC
VTKPARAIALVTVVAAAFLLVAQDAAAHARYKSSTPARGEVLDTAPASVTIEFTQEVQKLTDTYGIAVLNEAGQPVVSGPATLSDDDRAFMTVALNPGLPDGRYVVRYTNVSDADGDAWAGAFSFYVGREPTEAEAAEDEEFEAAEGADDTPAPSESPDGDPTATPVDNGDVEEDDDGGVPPVLIIGGIAVAIGAVAAVGWFAWGLRRH